MKTLVSVLTSLFFLGSIVVVHAQAGGGHGRETDTGWDKKKASLWFKKEVWLQAKTVAKAKYDAFGREVEGSDAGASAVRNGIKLKPHRSINQLEFARYYTKYKGRWDKAFAYLQETDMAALPAGKYNIDDSTLLIAVSDGLPRLEDTTKWESHHVYADIHLVISGKERIGWTPITSLTPDAPYNPVRDIIFYGHLAKGNYDVGVPGTFYVFFPQDGHRANIRIGDQVDKKIVIKVKLID